MGLKAAAYNDARTAVQCKSISISSKEIEVIKKNVLHEMCYHIV